MEKRNGWCEKIGGRGDDDDDEDYMRIVNR